MKLFEVRNKPAPWLLTESAGKNTHIEHLEDLILNNGYHGTQVAFAYLDSVRSMLAQSTGDTGRVTVKWDGAPAIVCGIDPADGQFFVGTKSVFSKQPKLIKNQHDIAKWYSDKPELMQKMEYALKYLPSLDIGNVMQGDLMFIDSDLTQEQIGGELCYVFTPNTISYTVPVDSTLGKRIAKAKLGIVFHTAYKGTNLADMSAVFGATVNGLTENNTVWFDDATYKDYTGCVTLTDDENTALENNILAGLKTLDKFEKNCALFDVILANQEFAKYIKPFVNSRIRSGEQVGDLLEFLKEFVVFYTGKMQTEIGKLKGGPDSKAALARIEQIKEQEQFIADNSNTLLAIMAIYKRVIEIKLALVRKLQQVDSPVGTFVKTENGYQVMNPEGFVAIGHGGGAVKLVDRLEFSRQNFAGMQDWKKQ